MGNRRKYVRRDATVEKLSAIYLSDKTGKVKESTLKCYQFNIRKYILPHLGSRVAAEVTVDDVDDYMEALLERFSPKLVREVGSLLLAILRLAGINFTGKRRWRSLPSRSCWKSARPSCADRTRRDWASC